MIASEGQTPLDDDRHTESLPAAGFFMVDHAHAWGFQNYQVQAWSFYHLVQGACRRYPRPLSHGRKVPQPSQSPQSTDLHADSSIHDSMDALSITVPHAGASCRT